MKPAKANPVRGEDAPGSENDRFNGLIGSCDTPYKEQFQGHFLAWRVDGHLRVEVIR